MHNLIEFVNVLSKYKVFLSMMMARKKRCVAFSKGYLHLISNANGKY